MVVHHVASVYPIEIQLAQTLAAGNAVTGVTWDVVHKMNHEHGDTNDGVTKEAALSLLASNSSAAAQPFARSAMSNWTVLRRYR